MKDYYTSMTLQQLRAFLAVARTGSYVRAAAQLYLTQPAVFMQVRALERVVGSPLVERAGRELRLTRAGQDLLPYAQQICELADEAQTLVGEFHTLTRGHASVAAVSTAGEYVLPPALAAFRRAHPGITIRLEVANRTTVHARLASNEVDWVILGRPPQTLPCVAEPLLADEMVPIASPQHPLAGSSRVPLRRFAQEVFIVREPGSGTRMAFEELCHRHDIAPAIGMELGSGSAIKEAVAAGLGVSVVSRHALHMELQAGRLVVLDVEGFPIRRTWHVVQRADRKVSKAAAAFREFLITWARAEGDRLLPQAPDRPRRLRP